MAILEDLQAASTAARRAGYNIVGSDKLFEPLSKMSWLCQSLRIAPGAPTLFAGYGYSGKSVALQCLALAVSSGKLLWGTHLARKGRVLHLDYEQGLRITAERYQRLAIGDALDPRGLHGLLECGVLPSTALTQEDLCWMGEERALVLVDSWRGAHPGVDENSSDVRRTLDAMGAASEKTGCTFCTLHHARKPQADQGSAGETMSIRGSSGFFDGCQTVYHFNGKEVGAPLVTLQKDRIGGAGMDPFVLRIEDSDAGSGLRVRTEVVQNDPGASPEEKYEELVKEVKDALDGHSGGVSASELAIVMGKRKQSVLAALDRLTVDGKVIHEGGGRMSRYYPLTRNDIKTPFDD